MDKKDFLNRVAGCFVGVTLGDALGLPWEMMSHEDILEATNGLGVTDLAFIPPTHPVCALGQAPLGATSDDTALTFAVAQACITLGAQPQLTGMLLWIISRERQMALLETNGLGWGTGTIKGVRAIGRYLDGYADGRKPSEFLPLSKSTEIGEGSGCGPAMQISPLVFVEQASNNRGFYFNLNLHIKEIARTTHRHPDATIAAKAMSYALLKAADIPTTQDNIISKPQDVLQHILDTLQKCGCANESRVFDALKLMQSEGFLDTPNRLRTEIGSGFLAWESVPFAIGTWLRNMNDPKAAILEAINAGGDTDSTAAMVGALVGTTCGLSSMPQDWIAKVPDAARALVIAQRLVDRYM